MQTEHTVIFDFDGVISDTAKGSLYDQMDTGIRRLAQEFRLTIVSASSHAAIEAFLNTHGLSECFDRIIGSDEFPDKGPAIADMLATYGISHTDCVMVTDSADDIQAARSQQVEAVAAGWGRSSYDALQAADPFRIIHLPDEVPNAVTEFFHGKGTSA